MGTAFRIARAEFADSIWSGAGASKTGGRWNSRGVPVVYTAESRSLAALEQLVHLIAPRVLKGFVVAQITFDDRHVQKLDPSNLPPGWDHPRAPLAVRSLGDHWAAAQTHAVLAVPSAVISGEWNYLFNPAHPGYAGMKKSVATPFLFDDRLG